MEFEGKTIDIKTALDKLEKISRKLENGKEGLEENLKLYSTAMELCLKCEDELKKAKLKIEYYDGENIKE